jgi:hypothetical protein
MEVSDKFWVLARKVYVLEEIYGVVRTHAIYI